MSDSRPLLSNEDLRQFASKVNEHQASAFTWQNLSTLVAKTTLFMFFCLWSGVMWVFVQPQFFYVNEGRYATDLTTIVYGMISLVVVFGMALACTLVPSIFWSSFIAQTPAHELMNRMYRKLGVSGFYIAFAGAIVFSILGLNVFHDFWAAKPNVAANGEFNVWMWALVSAFLAIVFPAWALNRVTASQWIAAMIQANEVEELQHQMALRDMVRAAMLVRADVLLHADLLQMTAIERQQNAAEIAALTASSERRVWLGIARIGATFKRLHNISLDVNHSDAPIVQGYQRLAEVLGRTAEDSGEMVTRHDNYVKSLADVTPNNAAIPTPSAPRANMPPASATTISMAPANGHQQAVRVPQPPQPLGTPQAVSGSQRQPVAVKYQDELALCRNQLTQPFRVSDIARVCGCSTRTADRIRVAWQGAEIIGPTDVDTFYFWIDQVS